MLYVRVSHGPLHSTCLTTKKEMCLLVWLTWDGSLDTPMWCMGLSAMEQPLSCLKALQPILMRVKSTIIVLHRLSNLSFFLTCYVGCYWETVEQLKVNQFHTTPSAIRRLMKSGDKYVKDYDLSSLRTIRSGVCMALVDTRVYNN